MKNILDHMSANLLDPGELTLDGKVHRFHVDSKDSKKSGWFIGFRNFSSTTAAEFYVVRYGNFQTGDVFQYQSENIDKADLQEVKKKIALAKKKEEELRNEEQERTSKELTEKWDALQLEGPVSGYLASRGLTGKYGAKTQGDLTGTSTYVPMRDVDGKLWSIQTIQANGSKFFHPGGRVKGCFHQIGELSETIRICEGFATGATIHEATGEGVFVAFNAGNLVTVAKALREKYQDKAFVICGDDDKGKDKNVGKEKAEEAAKSVMGEAVFPVCGGSDFDDLRQESGIESVREQLCKVEGEKHYVKCLGYDNQDYFFISNVNPQIQTLSSSQLNSSGLLRLQPLHYWESLYPANRDGVSWTRAASELMERCHARGIFKYEKVRGRGVWSDEGRIIYHRGSCLWIDGKEHPLHSIKSKYIYELDEDVHPVHGSPLSLEECSYLLDVACSIRWKRKESHMFFSGWIVASSLGGALPWRPHIWVTGSSSTGKSYSIQEVTFPVLRAFCNYFRGATTEAGIRQTVGSSTLPILFDEFETNDEQSGSRIRAILELARQASSTSDGIVAKGTVSGRAMEFRPQFSMAVGSVRTNLIHEEDENRFTLLELSRPEEGEDTAAQWETLKRMTTRVLGDYGERLLSRTLQMAPVILQSAKTFQAAVAEKFSMRTGQQYGTLLAGYWALTSDQAVTIEEARALVGSMEFATAKESFNRKDEEEALEYLLTKKVTLDTEGGRREYGIGEAIQLARAHGAEGGGVSLGLQRLGLKATATGLCIAGNSHSELENSIFRGTKWSKNWINSLSRLKGSEKKTTRILGRVVRMTEIPINS